MYFNRIVFFLLLSLALGSRPIDAAISDWFWSTSQTLYKDGERKDVTSTVNVPYELKTEDEKFLEEALKFTDIMKSSALDVCQHNVVLKIKTSCSSMTEEELAKMSVNLLNCQSAVDGRKTFPCSEAMSLKQCTVDMDANMWNAYHMMNNRARAVCLAARREQFQVLSEMTVNKLLTTAQEQIRQMGMLQEGQEELESLTTQTMGAVREGNVNIMLQQEKLVDTQTTIEKKVLQNLKDLSLERSLIAAGNRELDAIKLKLDKTNKDLAMQSLERTGQHQQIIADIEEIRSQAAGILERIEHSTAKLIAHHMTAAKQYEDTIRNLKKINETVGFLTQLFTTTHVQLEERIEWIKSFLGDSGEEIAKVSATVLHVAYLLMGMLVSSFLKLPFVSRAALTLLLPLNLLLIYDRKADALDFSHITVILVAVTLSNVFVNFIVAYSRKQQPVHFRNDAGHYSNGSVQKPVKDSFVQRTKMFIKATSKEAWDKTCSMWVQQSRLDDSSIQTPRNDFSIPSSTGREPEDFNVTATPNSVHQRRHEPLHNRVSRWLEDSKFPEREGTPLSSASVRSGSPRAQCTATCKTGRQCRKPSTPGREWCKLHLNGSSVVG